MSSEPTIKLVLERVDLLSSKVNEIEKKLSDVTRKMEIQSKDYANIQSSSINMSNNNHDMIVNSFQLTLTTRLKQ